MSAHRILLYGASNLWLSRRAALTELRKRFPGQLEIGLAHGPGRSYGLTAGNPLVRYEPLHGVNFQFEREVSGEKLAFLTDIGNDIAYSQDPTTVLRWVTNLATRLEEQGYRVMIGGIPSRSLSRLDPRLFKTLAKLYYPDGSLTHELVSRNLEEVAIGVRELCGERDYPHLELDPEWYSYDRFHLKRRARQRYWETLLSPFPVRQPFDSSWSLSVRRPLFPERFWLVGKERRGKARYSGLVPHSITLVR